MGGTAHVSISRFRNVSAVVAALAALIAGVLVTSSPKARAGTVPDLRPSYSCDAAGLAAKDPAKVKQTAAGSDLVGLVKGLRSGETLVVAPGEYRINASLAITQDGVTICGRPDIEGGRPRIVQNADYEVITVVSAENVKIDFLDISASAYDMKHDMVTGVAVKEGSRFVSVWNVYAHDLPACGICSARSDGRNDFRYNWITRVAGFSRYRQSGISLYASANRPEDGSATSAGSAPAGRHRRRSSSNTSHRPAAGWKRV
jgi:hypothetical protein